MDVMGWMDGYDVNERLLAISWTQIEEDRVTL